MYSKPSLLCLFFVCFVKTIFAQEFPIPALQDTIRFLQYPDYVNLQASVSLNGETVWGVSQSSRLYVWNGKNFEDRSLPDEEYSDIFAAPPGDIWLHIYNKRRYRYFFKRFRDNTYEIFDDPDNFMLFSCWVNSANDIWISGILGTLLHFDGHKLHSFPGITNNHISKIAIDKNEDGLAVFENPSGKYELFRISDAFEQVHYLKRLGWSTHQIVPDGLWAVQNDTLMYTSGDLKFQHRYLINGAFAKAIIPLGKNVVYVNQGSCSIGMEENMSTFLVRLESGKTALKLLKNGQVRRLTAEFLNQVESTQFLLQRSSNMENEYAVGFGFLNDDDQLDYYTILPASQNRLMLTIPAIDANGRKEYHSKEKTLEAGAAEMQTTPEGLAFYDNGILIADLNNDGAEDMYITAHQGSNLYLENVKDRGFRDRTRDANLYIEDRHRGSMAIAGDVDNDGDQDLFATDEYGSNHFYLNRGRGHFADVTGQVNLTSERGGIGCAFADIDSDGDLDLFVANWRIENKLYRNEGINAETGLPFFSDFTDSAGVALDNSKRSNAALFADVDNDGDLDLFVVNRGVSNRLYLNNGRGIFRDVTREAGLFNDRIIGEAAVFLDADNDGDMDLALTCKGPNIFYRNRGDGVFYDDSQAAGFNTSDNSGGLACGDFDNDGDIDLYAPTYDQKSIEYSNRQNDQRFIKLRLAGYRSNRAAVGAKVFFYESGHYDDPNFLLGLRTVEAGTGLASTSSKVVHFGTGGHAAIDCKIVFPSGVVVARKNISPGSTLMVEELSGKEKRLAQIKLKWQELTHDAHFQIETFIYFSFAAILFLVFPNYKKEEWKSISWHYLVPVAVVVIFRVLLQHQPLKFRLVFPLAFGAVSFVLVMQYLYHKHQIEQQDEVTDHLWRELTKFAHGDWARSNLNQLLFFSQNITAENQANPELRKNFLQNINGYIRLTHPSLMAIAKIGQGHPEFKGLSESISSGAAKLYRQVENMKNEIQIVGELTLKRFNIMAKEIPSMKSALDSLSHHVEKKYECPIRDFMFATRDSFVQFDPLQIKWQMSAIPDVKVRIRPSDLTPIFHNLIQNAKTATRRQPSPTLNIFGKEKESMLFIHFADNGTGIPPDHSEQIFREGFTTSQERGKGKGLAFTKQILQKYGGDIYVAKSEPGQGTEFVIELVILA